MALCAAHCHRGDPLRIGGGATYLLNWGTDLLSTTTVSRYIIYAVQGLEFFLFAADFICLVVFVIKETWIFLREILR